MMVGRKLDRHQRTARGCRPNVVLDVRNLATAFLSNIKFKLRAGEVLGVAGLVGAGRSELGATLFGLRKPTSGHIQFDGHPFFSEFPAAGDPRRNVSVA